MQILAQTSLPTKYGTFQMIALESGFKDFPHIVLTTQKLDLNKPLALRIHSECMTGDVFGSWRCDCGDQLDYSMRQIAAQGGVLVYLRQEGRGIGLVAKMRAYNLQDQGMDTYQANIELGYHQDQREFSLAVEVLEHLGITQVKLLTNNPDKIKTFEGTSVQVVERLPIEIQSNAVNEDYLKTKKNVRGHLFDQFS